VLQAVLAADGPRTRGELALACALSRPTTFAAVDRLEALGLVAPVGQRSGSPGRTATLYDVSPSVGCVAGIDLGGTNLRVAVCDVRGRVLAETRRPSVGGGGEAAAGQATAALQALLAEQHIAGAPLVVGVSVPGVVDPATGLVSHAWNIGQQEPYDLHTCFTGLLATTVLLGNNVNLAALGEQQEGAARAFSTFVVVSVGAGVGAGIVHDGHLVRGARGAAGEVAFAPLRTPPRGSAGVADEAGAVALLAAAGARTGWRTAPPADVAGLFALAAEGDPLALELVHDECRRIGEVLAAVCAVVDPEAILLAGGVGGNPLLIEGAARVAAELVPVLPPVLPSGLGEQASLVGAVFLAVEQAREQLLDRVADGDQLRTSGSARTRTSAVEHAPAAVTGSP
jgi:predicted NBD/HSP70 family sugar kinase